ncbi:Bacterial membrane protein YfhO [Planctomycetes bacterium Pan216]|uniref:Bacterial membrane protein YfhO n=1 Tax=Kolteria novifilia TaxID=2527975 RepID=A0A518B7D2_9BACT|nr:Bacterial membrane protein YfhO [Planctomycetes bacterium Pan216]
MHRFWLGLLIAGIPFALLFHEVVLDDQNFVYRDAGHFYYPLFKLCAEQWRAGNVPLWNPHENGGQPLAANATSSVFYPLKVFFLCQPYGSVFKWYLMGHVVLAWCACWLAAVGFGIRSWGAAMAATAYAFSGFVLFQLYNIIFLCGAAWLPLGLLAMDRLVRRPRLGWALLLAGTTSLQLLAGDAQIAFMTFLVAIPYFLIFHFGAKHGLGLIIALLGLGFGVVQGRDLLDALGESPISRPSGWWVAAVIAIPLLAFGLGTTILLHDRRQRSMARYRPSVGLFVLAAILLVMLTAVQTLPTVQFTSLSDRAAPEAPHESIAFSFFPLRVVELLLPWTFGRHAPRNAYWMPWSNVAAGTWVTSIYLGLLPALLAVFSARLFGGGWKRQWLTWLTIMMFWLSIGKFGGIAWLPELFVEREFNPFNAPIGAGRYGPSDGLYYLLEMTVPLFGSFRYPAKMLVFCTLGVSLLAGIGLDRLLFQPWPQLRRFLVWLAGIAVVGLVVVAVLRTPFLAAVARSTNRATIFGPVQPSLAWFDLACSWMQFACMVAACCLVLVLRERLGFVTALVLLVLTALDLSVAGQPLMLTDRQSILDEEPTIVRLIREEEAKEESTEPFRVYRTRIFSPLIWNQTSDPRRLVVMSRWERNTIQPKYGVPFGIDYTHTAGTMGLYDNEFFFAPWIVETPETLRRHYDWLPPRMAYFPRMGINLWNTKYFVVPSFTKFDDEERGVFTLLFGARAVPTPKIAESPGDEEDFQLLRNPEVFPRAWVVHTADFRKPIRGLRRADRQPRMEELLYRPLDAGVPLWQGKKWGTYPHESTVMLEVHEPLDYRGFSSGGVTAPSERVRYRAVASDEVEMEVTMTRPGFLVIADAYYPGWYATVDDAPAAILRANRAMRAIPLGAGHHLVRMRYRSIPFLIGALFSVGGLFFLGSLGVLAFWRGRR